MAQYLTQNIIVHYPPRMFHPPSRKQRQYKKLIVCEEFGGLGVKVESLINEKTIICEYAGELININEYRKRPSKRYMYQLQYNFPGPCSFNMWIDCNIYRSVACFVNHSCNPNTRVHVMYDVDGMPHVLFMARRAIQRGEFLSIDYFPDRDMLTISDLNGYCLCGDKKCKFPAPQ